MMRRIIIESPYRGDDVRATNRNVTFARACMRDALLRGEAPLASHLLYTQHGVLNDRDLKERLRANGGRKAHEYPLARMEQISV